MIAFPVCESLAIYNYGLFPGNQETETTVFDFTSGLNLTIGANGLGKTTLVRLIYRMLTGPHDLISTGSDSLGTTAIQQYELGTTKRREFGSRVQDGAEYATATLSFSIGQTTFEVCRSLKDLQLHTITLDDSAPLERHEDFYQQTVRDAAGLHSFADFLLVLRYIAFFFEDRKALVWDEHAQRQLIRALFLDVHEARRWSELERHTLELDSRLRNLNAVLSRQERDAAKTTAKLDNASDVRVQIEATEGLQQQDQNRQEQLGTRADELDQLLTAYRLRYVRAQHSRDAAQRDLEHAQLAALKRAFPSSDETIRYIFAQLVSDGFCRACGQESPAAAERMLQNMHNNRCAVCDLPVYSDATNAPPQVSHERIERKQKQLAQADSELNSAKHLYEQVRQEHESTQAELAELSSRINQRYRELTTLYNQLPPEESAAKKKHDDLAALRTSAESLRAELASAQAKYQNAVEKQTAKLHGFSDRLKISFNHFAQGFLLENISLSWSPSRLRIGYFRENPYIEFPGFQLEISGSDFPEPVRRQGPDEVSESQREFIDLAFRMALIEVAGEDGTGTLIIDAPESSLDAVFAPRAARVLGRFAVATDRNRLIVTSNILPGQLLPELIRQSTTSRNTPKLLDLFETGVPTAAIRALHDQYSAHRDALFAELQT
jgi:hypothetical protein